MFLADLMLVIHFVWVIYMIAGFILTISAFRWRRLFDFFWLRTIHVAGIVFVGCLGLLGKYCPLTLWEMALRQRSDPNAVYSGSFIGHWIETLIYYDVDPLIITLPTIIAACLTLIIYILRPPAKVRQLFRRASSGIPS